MLTYELNEEQDILPRGGIGLAPPAEGCDWSTWSGGSGGGGGGGGDPAPRLIMNPCCPEASVSTHGGGTYRQKTLQCTRELLAHRTWADPFSDGQDEVPGSH